MVITGKRDAGPTCPASIVLEALLTGHKVEVTNTCYKATFFWQDNRLMIQNKEGVDANPRALNWTLPAFIDYMTSAERISIFYEE